MPAKDDEKDDVEEDGNWASDPEVETGIDDDFDSSLYSRPM